ncbi:unnamed protein product [Larinioides sclopetarius]|uniref:Uncharacterized protein n=1 Tax=Larinioides sclopetarius TaxID=280406 RepID=A0AAV1ZAT3_9ARAC
MHYVPSVTPTRTSSSSVSAWFTQPPSTTYSKNGYMK